MQGFCSTYISQGSKPQTSRTGGTGTALLSAWCPLSAAQVAQARTQFNFVHKRWRSEGYSAIGTVSFVGLDKAGSSEWMQHRTSEAPVGTTRIDIGNPGTCKLRGIIEDDEVPNLEEGKVFWA
ncbi:hypothetical protein MRX96_008901 [Rhipicephalus microplus]